MYKTLNIAKIFPSAIKNHKLIYYIHGLKIFETSAAERKYARQRTTIETPYSSEPTGALNISFLVSSGDEEVRA